MSRRFAGGVAVMLAALVAAVVVLALLDFQVAGNRARGRVATEAKRAAGALQGEVATLEKAMRDTARQPGLAAILSSRQLCSLAYSDLPVLGKGHLDLVAADGRVVCTSQQGGRPPSGHAGAPWLTTARGSAETIVTAGYRDPVMETPVLVILAPVKDSAGAFAGVAAAFHPLAPIAPSLVKAQGDAPDVALAVSDGHGPCSRRRPAVGRGSGRRRPWSRSAGGSKLASPGRRSATTPGSPSPGRPASAWPSCAPSARTRHLRVVARTLGVGTRAVIMMGGVTRGNAPLQDLDDPLPDRSRFWAATAAHDGCFSGRLQ